MAYDADDPSGLVGEELNTVAFVMDYVEFHFNGPKLTALTDPHVQIGSQTWIFPQAGSRDALCTLIGRTVQAVSIKTNECILLDFGEAILTIPLDEDNRHGPEAAHFFPVNRDGSWRPEGMRIW
ncbi:hypothetical protein IMZ11_37840 [Microtetraspora sp. AC03309]|uniref:hypothetical protein n=1 Tax=Microtetraspora sp. AC03309 TaxID=2779376 RepID=UPI001E4660A1|nr:hypothetical protein [Microtetraspora sp. AC03309]MCC5581381.1 hypothetical protein [Microtetraspora sp. AC03309]